MRLNQMIASRLGISRRQADKLILSGLVSVDGSLATFSTQVTNSTVIMVQGKVLPKASKKTYLLFNKPTNYVCSHNGQGSKTIYDLLPPKYHSLNSVGRLDKNSSGLLLLTNDGNIQYRLTHPRFEKQKTYEVNLNKSIDSNLARKISQKGIILQDGMSKFKVSSRNNLYPSKELLITMTEGRNRQIRRTFEALDFKVSRLNRISFGIFTLDSLKTGEYKEVSL